MTPGPSSRTVRVLKSLVPLGLKVAALRAIRRHALGFEEAEPSFSHCGEDRLLAYLFKRHPIGFYVDVGAYEPIASSNTFLFYLRGWRGINIDAFPGSMQAFLKLRPRDVNLELAVADKEAELIYYQIGEGHHQMNGFSLDFQSNLWADFGIRPEDVRRIPIPAQPLRSILARHLPPKQAIDFMAIDVEGLELPVLRSNDWDRYRPKALMIEHHPEMSPELFSQEAVAYLASRGYRLICKTPNELIFLERGAVLDKSGILIP